MDKVYVLVDAWFCYALTQLTLKAPPIICNRQFQILPVFFKKKKQIRNIIPYFIQKLGKMSQKLSSAAIVIGALRIKKISHFLKVRCQLSSGTR